MTDVAIPRWLRSPHVQTLIGAAPIYAPPKSHENIATHHVRIPVADGKGRLHARAWWQDEIRTAVILAHGIGAHGDSRCVLRAAVALHRAGHHVIRFDMRGAGASTVDSPSLYHGGLSSDLEVVAGHVAQDPRVARVVLFGFSGGGNMALKLAGEWGANVPAHVAGVVSVSAPLWYPEVSPWMDQIARLPYRAHVLGSLLGSARAFALRHPSRAHYTVAHLKRIKTFRAFDGEIIAPMHGFPDVDTYYEQVSSGPWLSKITVPTLLVHSDDDPMVPKHTVQPWLARASKAVAIETTRHGGHIGFFAGFDEESWVTSSATRHALRFIADRGAK